MYLTFCISAISIIYLFKWHKHNNKSSVIYFILASQYLLIRVFVNNAGQWRRWFWSSTSWRSQSGHIGLGVMPKLCKWWGRQSWPVIRRNSATAAHLGESGIRLRVLFHTLSEVLASSWVWELLVMFWWISLLLY